MRYATLHVPEDMEDWDKMKQVKVMDTNPCALHSWIQITFLWMAFIYVYAILNVSYTCGYTFLKV